MLLERAGIFLLKLKVQTRSWTFGRRPDFSIAAVLSLCQLKIIRKAPCVLLEDTGSKKSVIMESQHNIKKTVMN